MNRTGGGEGWEKGLLLRPSTARGGGRGLWIIYLSRQKTLGAADFSSWFWDLLRDFGGVPELAPNYTYWGFLGF